MLGMTQRAEGGIGLDRRETQEGGSICIADPHVAVCFVGQQN